MGPFQQQVERRLRTRLGEVKNFSSSGGIWLAEVLEEIVHEIKGPIFDTLIPELVAAKIKLGHGASGIGLELNMQTEDDFDPFARLSLAVFPAYGGKIKSDWLKWNPAKYKALFPETWKRMESYGNDTGVFLNKPVGFVFRTDIPIDMKGSRVAHPDSVPKELEAGE